jgi:transcriptional regulator with XRE-family HTH domain
VTVYSWDDLGQYLRLREERLQRGWTQLDLAVRTGLPPSTISVIERGRVYVHPGWRRRLARAFGMSEAVLFARHAPVDGSQAVSRWTPTAPRTP